MTRDFKPLFGIYRSKKNKKKKQNIKTSKKNKQKQQQSEIVVPTVTTEYLGILDTKISF